MLDRCSEGINELRKALPDTKAETVLAQERSPWAFGTDSRDKALGEEFLSDESDSMINYSIGWPCARLLDCKIAHRHQHSHKEVLGALSVKPQSGRHYEDLIRLVGDILPNPDGDIKKETSSPNVARKDAGPDMQWRPCSMLDAYGTSTDALRSALPPLTTTAASPDAFAVRFESAPTANSSKAPKLMVPPAVTKKARPTKTLTQRAGHLKRVSRSDLPKLDVSEAASQMANLRIADKGANDELNTLCTETWDRSTLVTSGSGTCRRNF